jgi:hypothetical protein
MTCRKSITQSFNENDGQQAQKSAPATIAIASSGIFVFIAVSYLFSLWLPKLGAGGDISAALIVATGCFSSYIILAAAGVVREFSIKGGSFELTAKILEREIENVKTNVNESKRDITEKISALTQSMQNLQLLVQSNTFRQSASQTTILDLSPTQRELLNNKGEVIEENLRTPYDFELSKTNRSDIVNDQTGVQKKDG